MLLPMHAGQTDVPRNDHCRSLSIKSQRPDLDVLPPFDAARGLARLGNDAAKRETLSVALIDEPPASSNCPSCGATNPVEARFCNSCGAQLQEVRSPREERKLVSVLFVDLVGFTARSDRADPEDVREALQLYHAEAKRRIEQYGGVLEKFIGDAVMAVFGAPVAHGDDAERAVRAGLRVLEGIDELNSEHGLDLAARAAVNTGEAVVLVEARGCAAS